ncbi:MAG: serine hydrolase [Eubacterium sp.]|nr:serine hydrolase [Eubacterium sp.]
MKNVKKVKQVTLLAVGGVIIAVGVLWLCFGEKIKILYTSLNSFKDENLAHTFQHTPEIQPTKKISKGADTFQFVEEENIALADGFSYEGTFYPTQKFMEDTKTSAMLVVKDDVIKYEKYFFGGDKNTLFSSNSMGKSFVLALMGTPAMNVIAKYGMQEEPYTYRRYLSINTEILGQVIKNATGCGLAEYMEEKLWKKIGVDHDAYWTLSNGTELAMGGLSVSLRDYARFARLYLHEGSYRGEQILTKEWVKDSMDVSAEYSKPGANQDDYNAIGYGYQWWVPEGDQGEFMAIGVYGQWIYVNPQKQVIIVKTNADPDFMSKGYEQKHIEFFRAIADGIL